MGFDETDPTARRRWGAEAQRQRDAEILRLYHAGVSQRRIAKQLGCTLGSVQHVVRREKRAQKAQKTTLEQELDAALARYNDVGPHVEDVLDRPDLWPTLNPLERHRLRYQPAALALIRSGQAAGIPPEHDPDHKLCCLAHGLDPNWRPDDDGVSWRERCDTAKAGETDADDW